MTTPLVPQIFSLLSAVLSLYMILCFVRIILSWFPQAQYSPVGRFFCAVCDPYLNLFRPLRLRFGAFDFSPAVALCILIALSSVCANLARGGRISVGGILALLLSMAWSVVSSVLGFLIVLLIVRLVVLLLQRGYTSYGTLWDQFDRSLSPIVFRITALFTRGAPTPYKTALVISILTLVAVYFAGRYAIGVLAYLLQQLPF